MNKNVDIIIIEDDEDDRFMMEEAFNELNFPNQRVYFPDGVAALQHLHENTSVPFLILSDINLPKLSGFELRAKLHEDEALSLKCIPYLFFTTAISQQAVIDAYSMSAQGFFVKPTSFVELVDALRVIVEYWKKCASPNNFPKS